MPRHFGNDVLTTGYDPKSGKTIHRPGPDGIPDYPWEDPDYTVSEGVSVAAEYLYQ